MASLNNETEKRNEKKKKKKTRDSHESIASFWSDYSSSKVIDNNINYFIDNGVETL